MKRFSRQACILFLLCLQGGIPAGPSEAVGEYTPKQLIDRIIASENAIRDVQAEYVFFEPDTNLPLLYAQWGYKADQEFIAGLDFRQAGKNLGYSVSAKIIYSLDDEQRFYHFREELHSGLKQLVIRPPRPFDLDSFRVHMTPNSLLGSDVGCGTRRSFGQALKEAQKVTLRKQTEQVDGHDCLILEAVGIESPEFSYDVRAWIDSERGFRPLIVEIFYNTFGDRKYRPFERITRGIYDIELRIINGIWFPIEGKRDNFSSKQILPPELDGLSEEQARQRFSERELKELMKKIREEEILSVPTRKCLVDFDSIRINQGIKPEKFVVKPPPDCQVWDEFEKKNYTVKAGHDGGNRVIPQLSITLSKLKDFAPPELTKAIYPDSLAGGSLPDLAQFQINLDPDRTKGKLLLVCFWDMQQRPSRSFIKELASLSNRLEQEDVIVVTVQASKVDENELSRWTNSNGIAFPAGIIKGNEQEARLSWAVKALPWLILADRKHIVTAEGFGIKELDEKIQSTE
jgi:hypothetical protein